MKNRIYVAAQIGDDLRTRSFFRRDVEKLISPITDETVLDFTGVRFVSRSVADELCEIMAEHSSISQEGMGREVKMMYEVVVRSRKSPRVYSKVNAKVYHLRTMEEMQEFFSSF